MPPHAIDQNQGLVGGKVAQRHRANERGAVSNREALRVQRRHDLGEGIGQIDGSLVFNLGAAIHINGRDRIRRRQARFVRACYNDRIEFGDLFFGFILVFIRTDLILRVCGKRYQ